ncbi:MAG: bacillithiol biosynthesis cysteine-adding enzyme BshC [Rhodothermales bacterium]|nr:bacillithiol biosynthesis cysteine-adding enzyme BshC [Rhodothermales bacterium]
MTRIPFSSFESFSRLFRDYTGSFDSLAGFFAWDYRSDDDLRSAAKEAASAPRNRSVLCAAVRRQAERFGIAEESDQLITRLEDENAVAVVTGQQLGLFGGPMYTLYKTLTAVRLADRITKLTDRPAVPVFWLEGEDHDFAEVASLALLDRDEPVRVRYERPGSDEIRTAVGRLELDESVRDAVDRISGILPDSEFSPELIEVLRSAYRPGRGMMEAFVEVVSAWIGPGKVLFLSPDDTEIKRLARDVFLREIEDHEESARRLADVSRRLEESYHAQVTSTHVNLFIHGDERRAVEVRGNGFGLHGSDRTMSQEELVALVDDDPDALSPNVVLRPLMQDAVLPTAAYVAGPGEVAYFAQFKPLYEWAGIPMPVIYPRASVTLLERRIGKVLDEHELNVSDFDDQVERLFRRVVVDEMDVDLEEQFKTHSSAIHEAVNGIKPVIEEVDRSLVRSAEATRAAFMKEWSKLKDKVVRAEKDRHDIVREQLERAAASLFPFGTLQERVLSPLFFMSKYGPDLAERILSEIDLDTREHQVIDL